MTSKNPKTCSIKKTTLFSSSAYCKLWLKGLCVHLTYSFASSTLKMGGGVFNCFSEARKLNF